MSKKIGLIPIWRGEVMEILKMKKEMASQVSHIYALAWKRAYHTIIPQDYLEDLSLERWTPLLQSSPFDGFVLEENGKYIATSSIFEARDENMKGWGEIISLYVLPNYLFLGYGKRLLSFVMLELQKKGFMNIYLWVLEENIQARNFYERNGFTPNEDKCTIIIGGKELVEIRYIFKHEDKKIQNK